MVVAGDTAIEEGVVAKEDNKLKLGEVIPASVAVIFVDVPLATNTVTIPLLPTIAGFPSVAGIDGELPTLTAVPAPTTAQLATLVTSWFEPSENVPVALSG